MPISLVAPLAAACIAPAQAGLWLEEPGSNRACEIAIERSDTALGITTTGGIYGKLGEGFGFLGDVSLCIGNHRLDVQTGRFDQQRQRFEFSGKVAYSGDSVRVQATDAVFDLDHDLLRFGAAEYSLRDSLARGSAAEIVLDGEQDQVRLGDVIYTSCLPGRSHWELRAGSIEVEQETGFGRARKLSLKIMDIPVLYLPSLSF